MNRMLCDGCGQVKPNVINVAGPLSPINIFHCADCRDPHGDERPNCTCGGKGICTMCVLDALAQERNEL